MSLEVKIALIVIASLLFLTIVFVSISTYKFKKFNKRIENKLHAVNVLLAQKYDILLLLAKLLKKNKIKIPSEFEEELSPSMNENLKKLTFTERLTVRSYLMKASQSVIYYAEQNQSICEDNEYLVLKKMLVELDDDYRKAVALYNADALGFNYWSHFFLFRLTAKILRLQDKEIIK